jgi:hypothetical protein
MPSPSPVVNQGAPAPPRRLSERRGRRQRERLGADDAVRHGMLDDADGAGCVMTVVRLEPHHGPCRTPTTRGDLSHPNTDHRRGGHDPLDNRPQPDHQRLGVVVRRSAWPTVA